MNGWYAEYIHIRLFMQKRSSVGTKDEGQTFNIGKRKLKINRCPPVSGSVFQSPLWREETSLFTRREKYLTLRLSLKGQVSPNLMEKSIQGKHSLSVTLGWVQPYHLCYNNISMTQWGGEGAENVRTTCWPFDCCEYRRTSNTVLMSKIQPVSCIYSGLLFRRCSVVLLTFNIFIYVVPFKNSKNKNQQQQSNEKNTGNNYSPMVMQHRCDSHVVMSFLDLIHLINPKLWSTNKTLSVMQLLSPSFWSWVKYNLRTSEWELLIVVILWILQECVVTVSRHTPPRATAH